MAAKYSRRHYEDFAEILRVHRPNRAEWIERGAGLPAYHGALGEHDRIGAEIIDLFTRDNPRFDRERFIVAATPTAAQRGEA